MYPFLRLNSFLLFEWRHFSKNREQSQCDLECADFGLLIASGKSVLFPEPSEAVFGVKLQTTTETGSEVLVLKKGAAAKVE